HLPHGAPASPSARKPDRGTPRAHAVRLARDPEGSVVGRRPAARYGPREMNGAQWLVAGCALGGLAALGAAWHLDRARGWETPRVDPGRLVLIRDGRAGGASGGGAPGPYPVPAGEGWVVAVPPQWPPWRAGLSRRGV